MWGFLASNPVLTAALVTGLSAFSGAWSAIFLKYLLDRRSQRIVLELKVDNSTDCLCLSEGGFQDEGKTQMYVRIKLYNRSPHYGVAKQACVRLFSVERTTSGDRKVFSHSNPRQLPWNEEGNIPFQPKDFQQGGPYYVDLLVIEESTPQVVHLCSHSLQADTLEVNNSYRFTVQATADNAKEVTKKIDLKIGEDLHNVKFTWF